MCMCVYRKGKDELPICLKTKTLSCIPKNNLKLCICVWASMAWLRALEIILLFKFASHNSWETAQLSKMLCLNAPLTLHNLGMILCHQSCLLHCLSLTCWKLIPFLESIWFFSYDFKSREHLITLVDPNAASREPLIIFIALMVSPSTNWQPWPWQYVNWTQSRFCTLLLQF